MLVVTTFGIYTHLIEIYMPGTAMTTEQLPVAYEHCFADLWHMTSVAHNKQITTAHTALLAVAFHE